MKASYTVPFKDFDYVELAKSCGLTAVHDGHSLQVTGSKEAIDCLSNNLGFRPNTSEEKSDRVIVGVEQEPRVQFTLEIVGERLPDLLRLPDGSLIVYVGRYASPGERHSYRRVSEPVDVSVPVKPWVQYTELKGS